ncbi:DUF7718 family protein [Plantactinospora sp. WMMB334]|uniref:DUF7718 family protein n=1 Tax=Plantactinospora sp. WMMB334 TaxID=3404119 RepID=UPI003B95271A
MGRKRGERRKAIKVRGGRIARRIVNMAIRPKKDRYYPPPDEACELPNVFHIYPTGEPNDPHRIAVRQKIYKGQVVDFAINQTTLVGKKWRDVARIDCCLGFIHRHQFDQDGNDLIGHQKIVDIPLVDPWVVVSKGYLDALTVMHDEWEDNYRRWQGDGA